MSEKQQQLVLSIIDFLNQSIKDGTVKQDDQEGLEVAIQCIGEAFGVDPSDDSQASRLSVKPATLPTIFDVFLKTRDKVRTGAPAAQPSAPAASGSKPAEPSAADKTEAEKLKAEGNAHMTAKRFDAAIDSYTAAIAKDGTTAVYYSNRAAAHSSKQDYAAAVADAEKAIEINPSFVRAYSRLGHAHYSLSDYSAAADAYRRGLLIEPSNAAFKADLQSAESRIPADETPDLESVSTPATTRSTSPPAGGMPDLGGMADMLRGMGGGGGGAGGMPDLASIMNNPQLMSMAQQMMGNGGMERLMSNPSVANMMNRMQSGGGMPSMSELMSDPSLRDIASQFGAGGAGGGAGR